MKFIEKLKLKAKFLKTEVIAIYLSMNDSRTPLLAKAMIALTISYAFSPIDLIPDFIPILGYLDDLILLPLMISACIKLIPKEVLAECRIKAKDNIRLNKKTGSYSALFIILLWIAIIVFIVLKLR
ncbi:MAG: YkvA family protein [Paludibacter sp.]